VREGIVIGKFLPPHLGHRALIEFARERCDRLTVLVGALRGEPIPGPLRRAWLEKAFSGDPKVSIDYTEEELPSAPYPSREVSKAWAHWLSGRYPEASVIFSSEGYGDYVADYMGIEHVAFDPPRRTVPVSATMIRAMPFAHWDLILPEARPYFAKRVCLYGPESTGKSTMAAILAERFGTAYVPEVARALIDERGLSAELMPTILEEHAKAIEEALPRARRLLFVDSDCVTTVYYAKLLLGLDLDVPGRVLEANAFDLYLFFDVDVPYVEDPQRFSRERREAHRDEMLAELSKRGIEPIIVRGNWEEREEACVRAVLGRWPDALEAGDE